MKDKVEELEKQLKQIKGTDSFESINFSDFCINSGLKFLSKFKCTVLRSTIERAVHILASRYMK